MADVMVTARMSEEKKEKGNHIFDQLGTNPSQTINRLYDYIIEHQALPFSEAEKKKPTKDKWLEAAAVIDGLSRKNRHSTMTDDEIRHERMTARGYVQKSDMP